MRLLSGLSQGPNAAPFRLDLPLSEWQMMRAERLALVALLDRLRPACSIEIGTFMGGSLAVLAHFSEKVYSLDVDPTCRERLGPRHPNVEFVTGRSQDTLPPLLERLESADAAVGFILIDGDHSREAVRRDIENVLRYRPSQQLYLLMHDSFNPKCRRGITEADWAASPYVHSVDVDFVPGVLHSIPKYYRQMWTGFALAVLSPDPRKAELSVRRTHELQFRALLAHSIHSRSPWKRLGARISASWQRRRARSATRDDLSAGE